MLLINTMSGADDTLRECARCAAEKPNGERCKLRTCKYAKYCWIHTKKKEGVSIKRSGVEGGGQGLYTAREFKKNDRIGIYSGKRVSRKAYAARPNGRYGFTAPNGGFIIDARSTQSGNMRYVNSCRRQDKAAGRCRGNNVNSVQDRSTNQIKYTANKNIPAGEELFVSYGAGYWGGGAKNKAKK